ncbi:MAG: ATPase, T2SS/T4P/T4SS family, partial [Oscillospiraceae bacterium]
KDILNRIARRSNTSKEINEGTPVSLGEFKMSIRYGAVAEPICPKGTGINFAIRIVKANDITKDFIVERKTATEDMAEFALMCSRYGVNTLVSGEVHSGKTGTLSFVINELKKDLTFRIGTIEHESRELNPFVYDENGNVINNAFSWVTRPSSDKSKNIDATELVATNNRFSADLVAFGEIRGDEAVAVLRGGNTGQSIITTTHSNDARSAYSSLVILCKMTGSNSFDDLTLYNMAIEAFPVVMFQHESTDKYGTKIRRIVEIAEAVELKNGHVVMNTIYKYNITNNAVIDGNIITDGKFEKVGCLSHKLKQRLLLNGCSSEKVEKYA